MTGATSCVRVGNVTSTVEVELSAPVPSAAAAEAYVAFTCFKTGPPMLFGVELEWLTHDAQDPLLPLSVTRLARALGPHTPSRLASALPDQDADPVVTGHPLPSGGNVTVEPGGQLEVSPPPQRTLDACVAAAAADAAHLRSLTDAAGLSLIGRGIDPLRPATRLLDDPRYAMMEAHFARSGTRSAGRAMMGATASVQLNVDTGRTPHDRWALLHRLGPALVAMFANSAVYAGRVTGWRSTRQSVWAQLDSTRTSAPPGDPLAAYARFALDATVMLQRRAHGWIAPPLGLTFRDWLAGALDPSPTYADLDYHLTTLFPPVRAKGHLELRYIDAQAGEDWIVPAAVVAALLGDPAAADVASDAAAPTSRRWEQAARHGLADPVFDRAARSVMQAALDGLERIGAGRQIRTAVQSFAERYTLIGRSPADDQLDEEVRR
jgi:glutamate--cysteine ligase